MFQMTRTQEKKAAMTGSGTPLVSVVIPVLDAPEDLERCLNALERQTYPENSFEVVVVDNGSRVPPRDLIKRYRNVMMVHERERSAYAARNRGIAEARGPVLAFTDADCIPAPGWIREGLGTMNASNAAFVGGRIEVVPERTGSPTCVEILEMMTAFDQRKYLESMGFAVTANVFVRKEVFEHVGPLNGNLKSGADLEFGNRVKEAGYDMRYSPGAVVRHPARRSFGKLLAKHRRVIGGLVDMKKEKGADTRQMLRDIRGDWPLWRDFKDIWERAAEHSTMDRTRVILALFLVKAVRVIEAIRLILMRGRSTWGG